MTKIDNSGDDGRSPDRD